MLSLMTLKIKVPKQARREYSNMTVTFYKLNNNIHIASL